MNASWWDKNEERSVVLLGPGTTSVAVAMAEGIGRSGAPLTPDAATRQALRQLRAELASIVDGPTLEVGPGLSTTPAEISLRFLVGGMRDGGSVIIRDIPGDPTVNDGDQAVFSLLRDGRDSGVVYTIDAPTLLDPPEDAEDAIAAETQRAERFGKSVATALTPGKESVVIFVTPVKAERYLRDESDADRLRAATRQAVERLIDQLRAPSLAHRCTVIYQPIKTAGSVIYSHRSGDGVFRKVRADATWNPAGGDQLVAGLLAFFAARGAASRPLWTRLHWDTWGPNPWQKAPEARLWLESVPPLASADILLGSDLLELPTA